MAQRRPAALEWDRRFLTKEERRELMVMLREHDRQLPWERPLSMRAILGWVRRRARANVRAQRMRQGPMQQTFWFGNPHHPEAT
jgi:hypothetical protein